MLVCLVAVMLSQVSVEAPAFDQAWQNAPARYEVGVDVRTATVADAESGTEIPCKVQQHKDKRFVFWTRTDDGTKAHRYTVTPNGTSALNPPVFVGAGDMLSYGRRGVVADLGIGLWATPMPIDWDGDGDWDLLYSVQDKPQHGLYLYIQEAPGLFRRTKRLSGGLWYPALADMNGDGALDALGDQRWCEDVKTNGFDKNHDGPLKRPEYKVRSFMARQADWDGDGVLDLIAAAGDWRGYGWDQGYDATGNWTPEALHGPMWFHKNTGTNQAPAYAEGLPMEADDHLIDIYGSPCPCIADWDGDGDLDIVCGEFRDGFTYFENVGSKTIPRLAAPRAAVTKNGLLHIDLCMMSASTCDWNRDGRPDLVVGHEDGRVSVMLNEGLAQGAPLFAEEFFLKEIDPPIKSGGLVVPWLDAATGDLYCGNTAGYIEKFAWKDGAFLDGQYLRLEDDTPFRIQAGYNLSIQGPAEAKWGYTAPTMGDLNGDGALEIVYNSITCKLGSLVLQPSGRVADQPLQVAWPAAPPYPAWNWWKPAPKELVVEWRTRPNVVDWDKDGDQDLVAIDHEGYLALFANQDGVLQPGQRVFTGKDDKPLQLTDRKGGGSGRVKPHLVDWDGDGDLDLIKNTRNAGWFENVGNAKLVWKGDFPARQLAGHTTAPQAVDWNGDKKMDLIVGAEDGAVYCYHRAAFENPDRLEAKAN